MIIIRSNVFEGTHWLTLARPTAPDGTTLVYSSGAGEVQTVSLSVFDVSAQDNIDRWGGGALTTGSVWFDVPQTDFGWTEDAVGYTLRHYIAPTQILGGVMGGHMYWATYTITTQSFGVKYVQHRFTVEAGLSD